MKSLFLKSLSTLFLVSFFSVSNAQDKIKVSESSKEIEGVKGNALTVEIYRADEKTVAKEWKASLKRKSGDVDIKGNSIIATDVLIESISDHEITIYALVKRVNKTTLEFSAIFLNGDRAISSSDAGAHLVAKKMVKDFANSVSKEAAKEHHKLQLGILEDHKKSLKKLTNDIEDANKLIIEKKKEIEEKTAEKEKLLKIIEEHNKTVNSAEKEIGHY
ncbi:MAG: hypothetical protein RJQ00_12640 [Vicingaceae bacterium]